MFLFSSICQMMCSWPEKLDTRKVGYWTFSLDSNHGVWLLLLGRVTIQIWILFLHSFEIGYPVPQLHQSNDLHPSFSMESHHLFLQSLDFFIIASPLHVNESSQLLLVRLLSLDLSFMGLKLISGLYCTHICSETKQTASEL